MTIRCASASELRGSGLCALAALLLLGACQEQGPVPADVAALPAAPASAPLTQWLSGIQPDASGGLKVEAAAPGGLLRWMGLRGKDRIVSVDGAAVKTLPALVRSLQEGSGAAQLLIQRDEGLPEGYSILAEVNREALRERIAVLKCPALCRSESPGVVVASFDWVREKLENVGALDTAIAAEAAPVVSELGEPRGLVIRTVSDGGLAKSLGLRIGDRIVGLQREGDRLHLDLRRQKHPVRLTLWVPTHPNPASLERVLSRAALRWEKRVMERGAEAPVERPWAYDTRLVERIVLQMHLDNPRDVIYGTRVRSSEDPAGIELVSLRFGGPLEKAGLIRGDIIVKVNDQPVRSGQEVLTALRDKIDLRHMDVDVRRGGKPLRLHYDLR